MWKKLCGALLTLTMLLALLPCRAEAVQLSAAAAILMDADSGEILFEKDAGRCMRIASTTKNMTALVALERAKAGRYKIIYVAPEQIGRAHV